MQSVISVLYYVITAMITAVLMFNMFRAKDIKKVILYAAVLIPFALRVARIK
ncbi:MAG: hypothetical protein WBL79_01140 [Bacillota bacterium]|jgi:hypothetical protein|nr:hypothetical protein [Bacillota bacterium]HOO30060.1 hypothetical protein [Bacillota bacterium]